MKHLLFKDAISPGCPFAPMTNNTANTIVAKYTCMFHSCCFSDVFVKYMKIVMRSSVIDVNIYILFS